MQKKSIEKLAKYAVPLKSSGRFFIENGTDLRNDFQRDRDRIIHSTAFRRLKHKTQVFVNTSGDHFRTRITHSLEVSQIARTLSKFFNLNEDLSETLSLAHDLGHTPFGHAGEEALNKCMKNYGGFDHNVQTLRIITILENRYYEFKGLNLSIETIDGLIKHNGPVKDLSKINKILGRDFFRKKINFTTNSSLEAQIASISDDIAYNSHDLEDGLKSNLFKLSDLKNIPVLNKIVLKHKKKQKVWVFIGDMTFETGVFHETYKYAKNFNLPIHFIIEDNSKSVCTDTRKAWSMKKLSFEGKKDKFITYYKYSLKYPHAGAGRRVQF